MATVTGITAAEAQRIENESIVDGTINVNGDLILSKADGVTTINAGSVYDAVHAGDQTGVHGVGTIVGTTETQTLSGKTLTSPTINNGTLVTPTIASFLNAQHTHESSAAGGFVTLDYRSDTTSTQRTVTNADPGPKTLSTISLGIGTWLVFGSYKGVTTPGGTSVRFRVYFSTSGGTLTTQGIYDEWSGTGLARGGTIMGILANATAGNVTITANFLHNDSAGSVTCDTDAFDTYAIMLAG